MSTEYTHGKLSSARNVAKVSEMSDIDRESSIPADAYIEEIVPGMSRYLEVKRLLEIKYNMHITELQMRQIFDAVLEDMPHEKRCRKRYGRDTKHHYRTRQYMEGKE